MVSTRRSWLPGSAKGFRNRNHRVHSSGDYRNPPPTDEHKGLREFNEQRVGSAVHIPRDLFERVGRAFTRRLKKEGYRVLVVSVSEAHVHLLVELPDDRSVIREILGRCKRDACHEVKHVLTGSVWSAGGEFKPVDDREHHHNVFDYILYEQGPIAWTWCYLDDLGLPRPPRRKKQRRGARSGPSLRSGPGVGATKRASPKGATRSSDRT